MVSDKVEVKLRDESSWTDVTDYVLDSSKISVSKGIKPGYGQIMFDSNYTSILKRSIRENDYVRYSIGQTTADTVVFAGFFEKPTNVGDIFTWDVKDGSKIAQDRTHTGVYSEELGNGDQTEIVKLIIDEELTELSYDSTSIPAKDTSIQDVIGLRFQNKRCDEIFESMAEQIGKVLFYDEEYKVNIVNDSFTITDFKLIEDYNTIGNLTIGIDNDNWGNNIIIDGKQQQMGSVEKFDGGGTTFTLDYEYESIAVTVDGDSKIIAFKGSQFADSADALYDQVSRKITFNSATGGGSDNVVVTGYRTEKVHYEDQNASSVNIYGRKDYKIIDPKIDTQNKAIEISDNFLSSDRVAPLYIISGTLKWDSRIRSRNSILLTSADGLFNETRVNLLEVTYFIGTGNVRCIMNNYNPMFQDAYKQFILRLKNLEERFSSNGQFIAKYIFFGGNIVISIDDINIKDQRIGNHFTLDHPVNCELDSAVYELDTGLGDYTEQLIVSPPGLVWREFLKFTNRIDTSNTTMTIDTDAQTLSYTPGQIFQTKKVFFDGQSVVSQVKPIINNLPSTWTIKVSPNYDNNPTFQTVTNLATNTLTSTGTGGLVIKFESTGTGTYEIIDNGLFVPLKTQIILE